ncbi:hypothetical protein ACFQY0_14290 [Haloferula chungangensis]|uniref:Uncharacterized protein n=1 Tax=Haloferula chungangensis TaxID=1048331 RepID=A0ABW2LAL9_9BACT
MPVTTLTEFHHWLLAEESTGAPFVLLNTPPDSLCGCAAAVACLLNEFDEESGGNWIAITRPIVHAIASDPAQRRLLGIADSSEACPPTSREGLRKVLNAIAKRGHVVFDDPLALEATEDDLKGFRASIGIPPDVPESFHIILSPAHFHARCLAPLIADSFLEWMANRQQQFAA